MKRFFAIFGICLASLIVIVGGVFGVKYLKGDFNPIVINPESIAFELEEYQVVGNFTITITTPTEDVTATSVTLSFEKGTSHSPYGNGKITDGVIIMPKQAKLNTPVSIELCKSKDTETNNLDWIKGGISKIVATSESATTTNATATIYVDVPVYKTELVVLKEPNSNSQTFNSVFSNVESSNFAQTLSECAFNAGDTVYLGLKYYPARSAYKYSKISSSNMFVEYNSQILAKMEELGLNYSSQINQLNTLLSGENININEVMNVYSDIINIKNSQNSNTALSQFSTYLSNLNNEFKSNLKYYTLQESTNYLNNIEQVAGTNLIKLQVTSDGSNFLNSETISSSLYSYTFYNSQIESDTKTSITATGEDILTVLETLNNEQSNSTENKKVVKSSANLSLTDVDVNTIELNGNISNFYTNKVHTIYAYKQGTNSAQESFLNIKLSNSNASTVNLQSKIYNLGIAFVKVSGANTEPANNIEFLDKNKYTTIVYQNNTYYLPISTSGSINNAYWQVYSNTYDSSNFKPVFAYFKDASQKTPNAQLTPTQTFGLLDATASEKTVSWTSTNNLSLGVISLTGIIDMDGNIDTNSKKEATTNYTYYTEIDLSKLINIPETNNFQTSKFFLYSDEEDSSNPISNYFSVTKSGTYSFNGVPKLLYELDGNFLKLSNNEKPTYSIKVIFATIKTNADGTAIKNTDGTYQFVKYSADLNAETSIESLSSLNVTFPYENISTLSGTLTIEDSKWAGVKSSETIWSVAQNKTDVLKVSLSIDEITKSAIQNEIENGKITVVAYTDKTSQSSFVKVSSPTQTSASFDFLISTNEVTTDTTVRFYFVYTIDGNNFLFPISYKDDENNITNDKYEVNIVKQTAGKAEFAFTDNNIKQIYVVIEQDDSTKNYVKNFYTTRGDSVGSYTYSNEITINNTNNQVLVNIYNFLGNLVHNNADDSTTINNEISWFLHSNNNNAKISEDGKTINFVNKGEVKISLYLGNASNHDGAEQTITFIYESSGCVSKVSKYDEATSKLNDLKYLDVYDGSTNTNPYDFKTIKIELQGDKSKYNSFNLASLIQMEYTLNQTSNNSQAATSTTENNDLTFTIKLKDSDSADKYTALCSQSGSNTVDYGANDIVTTLKLTKNLGEDVVINLLFVHQDLSITQEVQLTLKQTIKISDLAITYITKDYNSDTTPAFTNGKYVVYAGVTYTVTFKDNQTTATQTTEDQITTTQITTTQNTQSYYATDTTKSTNGASIGALSDDSTNQTYTFTFTFPDYASSDCSIQISNKKEPTYGDLKYNLNFKVESNIIIDSNQTYTLSDDSVTINLSDILKRDVVNYKYNTSSNKYLEDYNLFGVLQLDYDTQYNGNNKNISSYTITSGEYILSKDGTITKITNDDKNKLTLKFDSFTNAITITFKIKNSKDANSTDYSILGGIGATEGKITLTIQPQDLKAASANTFALYNGKNAIVLTNGASFDNNTFKNMFKENESDIKITISQTDSSEDKLEQFSETYTKNNKVSTQASSTLFDNTGYKVTVTKNGISEEYLIIISNLAFPFVTFKDENCDDIDYSKLDIYKLFVESNAEEIATYYEQAGIKYFAVNNNLQLTLATTPAESASTPVVTAEGSETTPQTQSSNIFSSLYTGSTSNPYNIIDFDNSKVVTLLNGDTATSYAIIEKTTPQEGLNENNLVLTTYPVGEETYLKVSVSMALQSSSSSSTNFTIPIIVKLEQNQKLSVIYPNASKECDQDKIDINATIGECEYGSSEYDNIYLKSNVVSFENNKMEYLSFKNGIEGATASINLLNNKLSRFLVYEKKLQEWETNDDFEINNLSFQIDKVYINKSGVWSRVEKIDEYANIVGGNLTIYKNDADMVRVKLKVSTPTNSINYYYISAGEEIPAITLYCSHNNSKTTLGTSYTISGLQFNDVISIGENTKTNVASSSSDEGSSTTQTTPAYRFYTEDSSSSKLYFRILNSDGKMLPIDDNEGPVSYVDSSTDNQIKIKLSPAGTTFQIEIYTQYGVLSTITVNVDPAFEAKLSKTEIDAGTTYAVVFQANTTAAQAEEPTTSDTQPETLITITPKVLGNETLNGYTTLSSIKIEKIEGDKVITTTNNVCEVDGSSLKFYHQKEKITFTLTLKVTLENSSNQTADFTFTTGQITINPRITTEYNENNKASITCNETVGNITFTNTKDTINGLFKDKGNTDNNKFDYSNNTDLAIWVVYDGTKYTKVNTTSGATVNVGVKIFEYTKDFQFIVEKIPDASATEPNQDNIIVTAYARVTIKPEYIVTINYPQYIENITPDYEYVQYVEGKASVDVDLTSRVSVVKYNSTNTEYEQYTDWTIALKDSTTGSNIENKKVTFTSCDKYEININITTSTSSNTLTYATYVVYVGSDSLFKLESEGITKYVGYGEDIFTQTYLLVTLPENAGFSDEAKLSISNFCYSKYDSSKENKVDYVNLSAGSSYAQTIYYKSGAEVRIVVDLATYIAIKEQAAKNSNYGKIYLNNNNKYTECSYKNEFDNDNGLQYTLQYYHASANDHGNIVGSYENIDLKYYSDVITKIFNSNTPKIDTSGSSPKMSTDNTTTDNELITDTEHGPHYELSASTIGTGSVTVYYCYDLAFNKTKNTETGEDYLTLNANETPDGYPFMNLFGVTNFNKQENQRKTFTVNNLPTANSKITLKTSLQCLQIAYTTLNTGSTDQDVYDFVLKAVGAANNGTMVTLTFTYSYNLISYTKELKVKVMPSNKVITRNEGSDTENSSYNPLKQSNDQLNKTFNLANNSITNEDPLTKDNILNLNPSLYIFVYNQYYYNDSQKTGNPENLVLEWDSYMTGDTDYFEIIKTSDLIQIKVKNGATFGNKKVTITFTDQYGYTVNYYVELIADVVVDYAKYSNVSTTASNIYEGDSITLYTEGSNNATTQGIKIKFVKGEDADSILTGVTFSIEKAWFARESGGKTTEYTDKTSESNPIGSVTQNTNQINIKFLSENDIWNKEVSDNKYSGTLWITIKADNSGDGNITFTKDETYTFSIDLTVNKRYRAEIKAEDTYLRDTVETDLSYYVSVYDYKASKQLGEPVIEKSAQLYVDADLGEIYISEKDANENMYTLRGYIEAKLAAINGAYKDMSSNKKNTYKDENKTVNKDAFDNIKLSNENEKIVSAAWDDLKKFGISQSVVDDASTLTEYTPEHLVMFYSVVASSGNKSITSKGNFERISVEYVEDNTSGEYIKNTDGTYTKSTESTTGTKYKQLYKLKGRILLNNSEELKDVASNVNAYTYNYYLNKIDDNGDMTTSDINFASTESSKIKEVNTGNKISACVKVETGELSLLEINISNNATDASGVVIQVEGCEGYLEIKPNSTKSTIEITDELLSDTQICTKSSDFIATTIEGKKVILFTGKIAENTFDSSKESTNEIQYVNGLSSADAKKYKNINNISISLASSSSSSNLYTPSLISETELSYDKEKGIYYNTETIGNINIQYSQYNSIIEQFKNATTTITGSMKVTTKYTSVDTTDAYKGGSIAYYYGSGLGANSVITLDKWSEGFKLIAGYGISETMSAGENKTFNENVANGSSGQNGKIIFKAGEAKISGNGGTLDNNLFSVSKEGTITLKEGFDIQQNFVRVEVYCLYGAEESSTTYQENKIGTVDIAFREQISVTATVNSTDNENLDITLTDVIIDFNKYYSDQKPAQQEQQAATFAVLAEDAGGGQGAGGNSGGNVTTTDPVLTTENFTLGSEKLDYDSANKKITIENKNHNICLGERYVLTISKDNISKAYYIVIGTPITMPEHSSFEAVKGAVPIYVCEDKSSALIKISDLEIVEEGAESNFTSISVIKYGTNVISTTEKDGIKFELINNNTYIKITDSSDTKLFANTSSSTIYINHYKFKVEIVEVASLSVTSTSISNTLQNLYTIGKQKYSLLLTENGLSLSGTKKTTDFDNYTLKINRCEETTSTTTESVSYLDTNNMYTLTLEENISTSGWYIVEKDNTSAIVYITISST